MNAVVFDIALTAYIIAAAAALGSLFGRWDDLARFARLLTAAGWVCHTAAIVLRGVDLGRAPVLTLAEVVSVVIWVAVLFGLWIEYRYGITTFGAFFLPVILAMGLGLPTGLRDLALEPQSQSGWALVHVALVLVGLAALVLNFGSALMYVLQERQIKAKRPGAFYYGLPALETLDHLTLVTLTVGFPFLTVGLALGILRAWGVPQAGRSWASLLAGDPRALFSLLMWLVYAATLWGRTFGWWRGRRAAYFAIAGFCVLLAMLGAGVVFHGRHGS
jgi:ABC-type transport system involved in cytochrome c biogenesis permease subunit